MPSPRRSGAKGGTHDSNTGAISRAAQSPLLSGPLEAAGERIVEVEEAFTGVDVSLLDSRLVTLAVRTRGLDEQVFGAELDLEPTVARRLGRELLGAADAADPD